jgi:hypothetical protein
MDPQPDPQTMKQILGYFVRNPQAADSLEGVARWRLLDEIVRRKVRDSQMALEWLVDKGFLRKTVVADMEPIFSLNPARAAEAAQFLHEADAADKQRKG